MGRDTLYSGELAVYSSGTRYLLLRFNPEALAHPTYAHLA